MISLNGSNASQKKSYPKTVCALMLVALIIMGFKYAPDAKASESTFIDAIREQGHYATDALDSNDFAIGVGYQVCAIFDNGGGGREAEKWVMRKYPSDTDGNPEYWAALFAQAAAYHLCPEDNGVIGPI